MGGRYLFRGREIIISREGLTILQEGDNNFSYATYCDLLFRAHDLLFRIREIIISWEGFS